MIGDGGGRREAAVDRIEAVHRRRRPGARLPPRREIARVAEVAGAAAGEVGVEGDDDVGLVEVVDSVHVRAEGHAQPFAHVVAVHRLPLVPLHARIGREELLDLRAERGRGDGLGEEAEAGAVRLRGGRDGDERGDELAPGADLAELVDDLGAVGIVEAEDRRLHLRVARAEGRGVIGVPLDLRRAAHVRLGQHAAGDAAEGHGRGEEERLAGDEVLRLADVRDDLLLGAVARGEAGQGHRRRHELDEVAPVDAALQRQGLLRELVRQHVVEGAAARELVERAPVLARRYVADAGAEVGECELRGRRGQGAGRRWLPCSLHGQRHWAKARAGVRNITCALPPVPCPLLQ
jgi:hypothetical protein